MSMYISLPNVANKQLFINLHNSIDIGTYFFDPYKLKFQKELKGKQQ